MTRDRARLTSIQLTNILAKKGNPAAPAAEPNNDAPKEARVSVIVRLKAAERKSLRMIALEQNTTVQALVEQAVHNLIDRNEK